MSGSEGASQRAARPPLPGAVMAGLLKKVRRVEVTDGISKTGGQSARQPLVPRVAARAWRRLAASFCSALGGGKQLRTSGVERAVAGCRPVSARGWWFCLFLAWWTRRILNSMNCVLFLNRLLASWGWLCVRVRTRWVPLPFLCSEPARRRTPAASPAERWRARAPPARSHYSP